MIKNILLALLLLTSTILAKNSETDLRLNHYPKALIWLKDADTNGASANNIAVLYSDTIEDYDEAIKWYKKAYKLHNGIMAGETANNLASLYDDLKKYKKSEEWYKKGIEKNYAQSSLELGLLYKKLHRYNDAIFYYKKAYEMGKLSAIHGLGLLYKNNLNNPKEAIKWYEKAAKGGYADSIKNLARYYKLEKNNNILGGAYFIALIDLKYPKQKVITYLKTKWNLTDEELRKAYKLQLKLDIPKHYTGGID